MNPKELVAHKAASLIEPNMIVGLGSGSTAECFIRALAARRLPIQTVASSTLSANLALSLGLSLLDLNAAPQIDLVVDGADEIDRQKRMIKGGGGAHVREKILAASSREMIVIVDESKVVDQLGRRKLPIEVLLYGCWSTRKRIEALGFRGDWRTNEKGAPFLTDNGNLLLDVALPPSLTPEAIHESLLHLPGVIDTGFFFGYAKRVLIGHLDGTVEVWV